MQHLDLSGIQDGVLRRDDRFGYLELATRPNAPGSEFIRCESSDGVRVVKFTIEQTHDLETGRRVGDPLE